MKKIMKNIWIYFITLCKEHGIILSEKKVEIQKREIEFLGMIIDSKGIKLHHI